MRLALFRCGIAVISASVLALSAPAQASNTSAGTISGVIVVNGKVFFNLSGTRSTPPACATETTRWVFDATSPAGQALMAAVLTFEARSKQISVIGTNTCPDWFDTETAQYIFEQ
jgi:hypothetical protein